MEKIQDGRFWGVRFNEDVKNMIFYKEDYYWGLNPCYHKIIYLFELDGLYFMYTYSSSYNGKYIELAEVSKEIFDMWSNDLRSKYPWSDGMYDDGKSKFKLEDQPEGNFSATVYPEDFDRITHPKILSILNEIKEIKEEEKRKAEEAEASRRKEYARKCSRVAKRLGVSFVNVLRLGYEDEERLKEFKQSMVEAKKQLEAMSEEERDSYEHEIFHCGRARMSEALEKLGVKTFGKDVYYMDFIELCSK